MKAVTIRKHGGPDVLSYEEVANPSPIKGHAIVRVDYCAVNHLDIWVRNGLAGKQVSFPHILGCDISGTLVEGFGKFRKGEKVVVYPAVSSGVPRVSFSIIGGFGKYHGGYAELVRVPQKNIIKKPGWFSDAEACALNISYLTAWNMLERSGCRKDDTILIWGANSGVGSAAILLAHAMGLRIITVVSSNDSAGRARKLGADLVVDRNKSDVMAETLRYTGEQGVDAVIDHVGAKSWPTSIEVLKVGGKMVACGTTTGAEATVNIRAFYSKEASITGAYLGTRSQLVSLHRFMQSKRIRPIIDSVFELKDAKLAHQKMEDSAQFGKIILKVSS
ncbi:MAG: zinc-binding dehydrogenase [Patescibacteria group bacterium]|nr:zinc-binding dehydrogenase [Patescibacteria group bacterium]